MGGPLLVIPVSALQEWSGCTESGMIIGDTDAPDDYDRACAVEDLATVIDVGPAGTRALVLGDEPARTCYLPERRAFVRWLAADSDAELLVAAERLLDDPTTEWEAAGVWETDGPAVLMDSAEAGADLDRPYPDRPELPEQAPVAVAAGRWNIRAVQTTNEFPWVGVVQLAPERTAAVATSTADGSPRPYLRPTNPRHHQSPPRRQ